MDELEWLKENSPPTRPSSATTRRHRTQLRATIAGEGADGTRPRRRRRVERSRHRVLVTTTVVVAVCVVGVVAVALGVSSGSGGEHGAVRAPAAGSASTTTATPTCPGTTPKQLAIPDGFGSAVAGPGPDASSAPLGTQQVTHWSNGPTTIEQRWPADAAVVSKFAIGAAPTEGISSAAEAGAQVDDRGVARRTVVFSFAGQPAGCADVQVTVTGHDTTAVDAIVDQLVLVPFHSSQPLVTTTGAAASAPSVVACDGVARADVRALAIPVVATVGGPISQASFARPTDALIEFLASRRTLAPSGYEELHLDDASITYVKEARPGVVTTVHVVPGAAGWTVADWEASGC